ncbi:MAG: NYN domain-containing protein [Dehalococcoidia bacterium]|nr:NYN domain-containing protein [Dehalococcoidia bacterium]
MAEERVMVFIDGGNLYSAVKDGLHLQKSVNIESLVRKLVARRSLVRAYYYTTPSPFPDSPKGKGHQRFLDKLGWIENLQVRRGRIVPRSHNIKCPKCKALFDYEIRIQKGVDTRIAVDMVTLAQRNEYDIAILVSGDSDLAEAVEYIREHTNKKVENACVPGKGWAKTLREAADKRTPLTAEYLENCLLETPIEEQAPL